MLNYNGLFEILKRRNMKKTDLLKVVSSGTLAKLNKNQNIQTEIIDKICNYLKVQPGDIMEYAEILSIELINQEHILYKAGYKQMIIIIYPYGDDEFNEEPIKFETLVSKKVYENTEDIENGNIEIPNTFIPSYEIYKKDPYIKKKLSEMEKIDQSIIEKKFNEQKEKFLKSLEEKT